MVWAGDVSIRRSRSFASSSCLECSQSYGDCVSDKRNLKIAVAWLHKWSKSVGEVVQWTAHEMTSHNSISSVEKYSGFHSPPLFHESEEERFRDVKWRNSETQYQSCRRCERLNASDHGAVSGPEIFSCCRENEARSRSSCPTSQTSPPEVLGSCHLFKCERARKTYLKDYLVELKGQLPYSGPQMVAGL